MRIKIIKFDAYGCKYTKIAVKTPQFTKEIAVFLPQNMDIASKHPFDAGFHLIINRCLNYFFLGLRRAQPSSSKFGSSPLNFTLSLFWKNWRQSPVSS